MCGVALPGLLQTAFRPPLPPSTPQTGVPSWHLGRKVELTSHRACRISILPSEKELGRILGECGGPETTRVFQAGERVVSSILGGGHLLRKRRNLEVQRDWRDLISVTVERRSINLHEKHSKIGSREGAPEFGDLECTLEQ